MQRLVWTTPNGLPQYIWRGVSNVTPSESMPEDGLPPCCSPAADGELLQTAASLCSEQIKKSNSKKRYRFMCTWPWAELLPFPSRQLHRRGQAFSAAPLLLCPSFWTASSRPASQSLRSTYLWRSMRTFCASTHELVTFMGLASATTRSNIGASWSWPTMSPWMPGAAYETQHEGSRYKILRKCEA